jgi:hypothetical protein
VAIWFISPFHAVDHAPVWQFNLAIAKQSGTIAAGALRLVQSLANAR